MKFLKTWNIDPTPKLTARLGLSAQEKAHFRGLIRSGRASLANGRDSLRSKSARNFFSDKWLRRAPIRNRAEWSRFSGVARASGTVAQRISTIGVEGAAVSGIAAGIRRLSNLNHSKCGGARNASEGYLLLYLDTRVIGTVVWKPERPMPTSAGLNTAMNAVPKGPGVSATRPCRRTGPASHRSALHPQARAPRSWTAARLPIAPRRTQPDSPRHPVPAL